MFEESGRQQTSSAWGHAGIFVEDIIDAVPIDKYFEMFKPGAAGEGGFIRVAMAFDEHKEEIHEPIEEVDEEPLAPTIGKLTLARTRSHSVLQSCMDRLLYQLS